MSFGMFLRDVWRRPRQMGAIAPSGAALARVMCDGVDLRDGHVIAELGAGTGSLTQEIRRRAPTSPMVAFEPGEELATLLRARFPDVRVSTRLAHEIPAELAEWGHPTIDRVISGLPWTIWPQQEQDRILSAVASVMQPDGKLVTFTYVHSQTLPGAGTLKALLARHFDEVTRTPIAWRNAPPAFAWVGHRPRR